MAVGSSANLKLLTNTLKETSSFDLPSYQVDAANLAVWLTGFDTLKTALAAITACTVGHEKVLLYDTKLSSVLPTSGFAIRETKILLRFQGNTNGKMFTREIAGPHMDNLTRETGDANFFVLADAGIMAAFVTAFEALARNPEDDSENVTVISAMRVGRDL